ncbi:MAG: ABC transporter permease [Acidobacteria bacterium]|nr:ABC transporter permease [Acidobacteriota bacterium]
MTGRDLSRRNLRHFWRTNAAMAAGVAIATATLVGSALIGNSVRESLRTIATARLGNTGGAITAAQPFSEAFATRVRPGAAPALHFEAVLKHQATNRAAAKVLVYGVDERFWKLHQTSDPLTGERDIVFSEPLAEEFNAQNGEGVLLRIEKPSEVPQESLFARKEQSVRNVRFRYQSSLPDNTIGGFTLHPKQGAVRAAFVRLSTLQKEMDLEQKANLVVMPEEARSDLPILGHLRLEDVGLRLTRPPDCECLQLESPSGLLRDDQVKRALDQAKKDNLKAEVFFTYLANSIRTPAASVPYSLVVARDQVPEGMIALNEWTAAELSAEVGAAITLDYFVWREEGRLQTESTVLQVNGVFPMAVIGDRHMAPEYPGISGSESLSDWDPPFPMDLELIRPRDEKYWTDYRTTPKAAVSLQDGQRLWETRFGKVTAIRFRADSGVPSTLNLTPSTDLARDGLALLAPKRQAEEASSGTTDFGEYFGYFSFFLVVSALLLTGLFFRLGIEQRLREIGLYRCLGFDQSAVRRVFLREGFVIGAGGALAGLGLGGAYSAVILHGLRTWWVDAVGTSELGLHFSVAPFTSAIVQGVGISIAIILVSLRHLRPLSPRQLLSGEGVKRAGSAPRWMRYLAFGLVAVGVALLVASLAGTMGAEGGFFGAGFCLLVGAALQCRLWLEHKRSEPVRNIAALAVASAAHRPARSFLTILLFALAVFLLVALESFRHSPGAANLARDSGTGGFPLLAESQWPIYQNLNTREGRDALTIDEDTVRGMRIVPFRVRPGEDVSCLNLYQPTRPKIVGVPKALRDEGRFRVSPANAWTLLEKPVVAGEVPAMVDANTLEYVLHRKVGDYLDIPHGAEPVRLRVVGTLSGSLFQSEILIGEEQFLRVFPEEQGFRFFLIDAPEAMWGMITTALEERLSDNGFDIAPAAERLAQYHRVENTYLSTFQALGALGLLIGTVGMAAVLLRNVLERRKELALLGAVGYTRSDLVRLVTLENLALLIAGLGIGTLCALLAVSPALAKRAQGLPLASLALLLGGVFVTGVVSTWLATRAALRAPLLDSLRSE